MKAFFSSMVLFMVLFTQTTMAKDGFEAPPLPRMFLKEGLFTNGQDEILVQESNTPGFQYIQVTSFDSSGRMQFFNMYRNAYTGQFYNTLDADVIRHVIPKRLGMARPDLSQQYLAVNIDRALGLVVVSLTLGQMSSERRFVDVTLDVMNSQIYAISFSVEQPSRTFLGIPFRYKAIYEGYVKSCEHQLTI